MASLASLQHTVHNFLARVSYARALLPAALVSVSLLVFRKEGEVKEALLRPAAVAYIILKK